MRERRVRMKRVVRIGTSLDLGGGEKGDGGGS